MVLGRVIGSIVSSEHHHAYDGRKLMLVRKLTHDLKDTPDVTMAIDYVGAGKGEVVLMGAAPGLASKVFNVPNAPIQELIMGIVDPGRL
jgi:ethanolamine utilization protein EutN